MIYILVVFLLLTILWMISGNQYFLYGIAFIPAAMFLVHLHALYGVAVSILTLYLINMRDEETPDIGKYKRYKVTAVTLLFCAIPVIIKRLPLQTQEPPNTDTIMLAIIAAILTTFIAASSTILTGIKRIKGDKNTHE